MARGRNATVGDTRVAPNGYHYTRTEEGWRLTHHIVAEKKYGRKLTEGERVVFLNGKRNDLSPSNVEIRQQAATNLRRRQAQLEVRIEELQAELAIVNAELAQISKGSAK